MQVNFNSYTSQLLLTFLHCLPLLLSLTPLLQEFDRLTHHYIPSLNQKLHHVNQRYPDIPRHGAPPRCSEELENRVRCKTPDKTRLITKTNSSPDRLRQVRRRRRLQEQEHGQGDMVRSQEETRCHESWGRRLQEQEHGQGDMVRSQEETRCHESWGRRWYSHSPGNECKRILTDRSW